MGRRKEDSSVLAEPGKCASQRSVLHLSADPPLLVLIHRSSLTNLISAFSHKEFSHGQYFDWDAVRSCRVQAVSCSNQKPVLPDLLLGQIGGETDWAVEMTRSVTGKAAVS